MKGKGGLRKQKKRDYVEGEYGEEEDEEEDRARWVWGERRFWLLELEQQILPKEDAPSASSYASQEGIWKHNKAALYLEVSSVTTASRLYIPSYI
jgi:hypothetical protein